MKATTLSPQALFAIVNVMMRLHKRETDQKGEDSKKVNRFSKDVISTIFKEINGNYELNLKFDPFLDLLSDQFLDFTANHNKVGSNDAVFSTIAKWKRFKKFYEENEVPYLNVLTHYATLPATEVWNRCNEVFGKETIPDGAEVLITGSGNIAVIEQGSVFIRQVNKSGQVSQSRFELKLDADQIKSIISNPDVKPRIIKVRN